MIMTGLIPTAAQAYVPGPPCSGSTCVGKNPYITNQQGASCVSGSSNGNNGAYDVTTLTLTGNAGGGSVTLRYSPYCAANWARWNGGNNVINYWVETRDGRTAGGYSGNSPDYTTMVDGTQLARVCYDNVVAQVSGCSGWY